MSVIYLLPSYNEYRKFNKMPLKVAQLLSAAMILGRGNISMVESSDADSQVVMRGQLQAVLDQLYSDNIV